MYPFVDIMGRDIGTYSLLFLIGFLSCGFLSYFMLKKYGIISIDIIFLLLAVGGGILIGGHLLYGITRMKDLINYYSEVPQFTFEVFIKGLVAAFGGNVFYGGLLGAITVIFIYTKFSKYFKRELAFDAFAFSIPLFHFFGRIGCFLGGCCYGIECEIGFVVHGNDLVPELNGVRRFPVALLEAFLNLCIFALLITLFRKEKLKGNLILVYLFTYGIVRFCTEFLRGDEIRGRVLCFSTSQWISLALITFVIIRVLYLKKKNVCTTE